MKTLVIYSTMSLWLIVGLIIGFGIGHNSKVPQQYVLESYRQDHSKCFTPMSSDEFGVWLNVYEREQRLCPENFQ